MVELILSLSLFIVHTLSHEVQPCVTNLYALFSLFIAGERKQSFQFTIHTESSWNKRSDWVLAAQSEREMKEWIAAFKVYNYIYE